MEDLRSEPVRRMPEPAVPATPDGTPPYADPLPPDELNPSAPDTAASPSKPSRESDGDAREP
jgi:hypothetical protein